MSNLTIHLTVLLFWPLALALLGATGPRSWAPGAAIVGAVVPFAYAVMMLFDYDSAAGGLQYVTNDEWIKALGIRYYLGVDGLNLWLIALTTLLFLVAAMWVSFRPVERPRLFTFHLALAETAVLGAFTAQDLALFVLFFDLMLVPFYFLVGQWGSGPDRVAATYKMIIYTLVGSLLMLAGAVATAVLSADGGTITFTISDLAQAHLGASTQRWIFTAFALAFLIKMPLFPFHGWMPDAYRTMPLPALAIFSGVLSKVAAYGFLRVVLPLFPEAAQDFQSLILILALLSILYGSAQAFTQTNARLVLGYSSVAQLGFITLGIFALDPEGRGAQGAMLQMVNHGLVVAPLFLIIVLLSERSNGTEDITKMGGIAFRGPVLASLFLIVALATLAMPGAANFVGEFLILLGLFETKLAIAIIAFTGVAMASVYMLRMFIRTLHNRVGEGVEPREMTVGDAVVIVPLVLAILAFALYPQAALTASEPAVKGAVQEVVR
jgi:NADH-quinone oxidoreductase subunit M